MKSAVSEKGQVTIPKAIRSKLGLNPGALIDFSEKNGVLVGRKVGPEQDPVQSVTGIIKIEKGVDEYMAACRGETE